MTEIHICGAGVSIPYHFTLETLDVLERCRLIYTILKPSSNPLPPPLNERLQSIWPLYIPGERRQNVYNKFIDLIIQSAEKQGPVAYLTQGNPVFFDSVTQGVITKGAERGIAVKVYPAVSALDTVLIDLRQDIAPGLQIYDASALVLNNIELRNDISCLIMQPHVFGTLYVAAEYLPSPETFEPLKKHLLRFYPPEHEIISVTSATSAQMRSTIVRFQIQDLADPEKHPKNIGASLFIPPSQELKTDAVFLNEMLDAQLLNQHYGIAQNAAGGEPAE